MSEEQNISSEKSTPVQPESPGESALTDSINEQAQQVSMEVQQHLHIAHHKKKWKYYLFEFFMLTLVVS